MPVSQLSLYFAEAKKEAKRQLKLRLCCERESQRGKVKDMMPKGHEETLER